MARGTQGNNYSRGNILRRFLPAAGLDANFDLEVDARSVNKVEHMFEAMTHP
jgi:hypothetical protein